MTVLRSRAIRAGSLRAATTPFGFDDVARRAQELVGKPFQPPGVKLPKELASLSYDAYRDIRFKPDASLWRERKLPFELQFFAMGLFYDQPVRMHEVVDGVSRPIGFGTPIGA